MADLTTAFLDSITISDGGIFEFHRQQYSRTGGGTSLVKELADPLWRAEYETVPVLIEEAMEIEAQLTSLGGSLGKVALYDVRRPQPKNRVAEDLSSRTLGTIASDRHNVTIGGTGFSDFAVGDWFSLTVTVSSIVKRYLHRVTKVNSSLDLNVFPAISPNVSAGQAIELDKPYANFQLDPDSVNSRRINVLQQTKLATVSFSAIQVIE